MCVEINLNAPLLLSYSVDGNELKIEYEGMHLICFKCGRFGHDAEHYPNVSRQDIQGETRGEETKGQRKNEGEKEKIPTSLPKGAYGEWMKVAYPKKGRSFPPKDGASKDNTRKEMRQDRRRVNTLRFAALEIMEEKDGTDQICAEPKAEQRQVLRDVTNLGEKKSGQRENQNTQRKSKSKTRMKTKNKEEEVKGKISIKEKRGKEEHIKEVPSNFVAEQSQRVDMEKKQESEEKKQLGLVNKGTIGPDEGEGMDLEENIVDNCLGAFLTKKKRK